MPRTKALVLACLMGGFALLGTGVAQAEAGTAAPTCVRTDHGHRCSAHTERTLRTEHGGSNSESTVSCMTLGEMPQAPQYVELRYESVMECSVGAAR